MSDGWLFIAPIPPKDTRWRRLVERYRGFRFRHSKRWTQMGLYTPEDPE